MGRSRRPMLSKPAATGRAACRALVHGIHTSPGAQFLRAVAARLSSVTDGCGLRLEQSGAKPRLGEPRRRPKGFLGSLGEPSPACVCVRPLVCGPGVLEREPARCRCRTQPQRAWGPGGRGHRPLRGWRRRHAVQGAPPCPGTNRPSPSPQRSIPRRPRRPASAPAALPRPLPAPGAPARGALCSPARTHADAAALPSRPTAVFGLCCRFLKTLKS